MTKKESEDFANYVRVYKKFSKLKDDEMDELEDDELMLLELNLYEDPKDRPQPRYKTPPVNILIMDDLLGCDCFSKKSKSIFQNTLIKSRHLNIAFQILVQSLKAVPKPVRLNCSVFWIGKFSAVNVILDDLYPEVSGVVSKEDFEALYKYAVDKPHGALVIDTTKPKGEWFSAGWDKMLQISKN